MGMLKPVPAPIVRGVPEPEVRPLVDDRDPALEQLGDASCGRPVGECEKPGAHILDELAVEDVIRRGEVRMDGSDGIAPSLAAGQSDEANGGMRRQEPDQLPADVPCCPDHPDPDGRARPKYYYGCMTIH